MNPLDIRWILNLFKQYPIDNPKYVGGKFCTGEINKSLSRLKSSEADQDTLVEIHQMRFIFWTKSFLQSVLFFHWCRIAWIPLVKMSSIADITSLYELLSRWNFRPTLVVGKLCSHSPCAAAYYVDNTVWSREDNQFWIWLTSLYLQRISIWQI